MRRYIFAALVALVGLTSCVVDDGYKPNKDNSSKLIYQHTTNFIYNNCTESVAYVIYADALLRGDAATADVVKGLFFSDYTATINGNDVVITPQTSTYYYFTVKTDGKPLVEGGVWSVYYNLAREPRITCTGIVGENGAFSVQSEYSDYFDTLTIDHTLRYVIDAENTLAITVTGSGEFRDAFNYTIEYQIDAQNPLVYKGDNLSNPAAGTINIDYLDENTGYSKSVRGTVLSNTVHFE